MHSLHSRFIQIELFFWEIEMIQNKTKKNVKSWKLYSMNGMTQTVHLIVIVDKIVRWNMLSIL